ncbi:MAG: hypothetical protein ACK53L_33925, partial [Pirellulaceae bacterium]
MKNKNSFDPYALPPEAIQEPPTSLWQALRMIGPGIVLAGPIVGSGEWVLTPGRGARAGARGRGGRRRGGVSGG